MIKGVLDLTKAVLIANLFCWSGVFYKQRRGLAMGCRIAPILATAFIYDIEVMALRPFTTLQVRYIDDILIVASSEKKLRRYFGQLNSACKMIRLTREWPENGVLPFRKCVISLEKISWKRAATENHTRRTKYNSLAFSSSSHGHD